MSDAPLAPCPACSRHVRNDAPHCPFCDHDLSGASLTVVPDLGARRLGRAALFAFATSVAAVGCNSPQRTDSGSGSGNIVQPYGAPPDPRPQPQPQPDAGSAQDPGLVVAIYGAPVPPPDAATPAEDATVDAAPDAAATPDAARDASRRADASPPPRPRPGPPMVRYGAPPRPDDDFIV